MPTIIGSNPKIANMWIKRDLLKFLQSSRGERLPVKILRGPRQVGKRSLLNHLRTHKLVLFDDLGIRTLAENNPALFFEQFTGPLILDEATLAPQIFPEIKKRVDIERRRHQETGKSIEIDRWIVSSLRSHDFKNARVVQLDQTYDELERYYSPERHTRLG